MYGLKQASRQWNTKFSNIMKEGGYCQSQHDHSLFFKRDDACITLLVVYVDDIVITGSSESAIRTLREFLHSKLQLKDLGPLKYFLGIEVARSKRGIYLNQRKYALELILIQAWQVPDHLTHPWNKIRNSLALNLILLRIEVRALVLKTVYWADPHEYQRLVGRLIYLTITRPDICYAVQSPSQCMHAPKTSQLDAAIRVIKYIKKNPGQGILLQPSASVILTAYCDSDWVACPMTCRSVTG